ncbi:MAG: transglutaminase family protein [Bacteroidaceae bacterium]|nr:transglutaminase family protein [Bacteroidaceae bacterium]
MKRYLYNYQTIVEFSEPVPLHAVMLRCQPINNACQMVEQEHLVLSPDYWLQAGQDVYYNRILFGGANEPHSVFSYVSTGIVATDTYVVKYCGENLFLFQQPTPLTVISDRVLTLRKNCIEASYDICQWLNENIEYQPQATTVDTTAAEVLKSRQGVCQDFAHLMIAFCRQQGIPARYVNGFLEGEGETHAWVEIFDGYNWLGFDPTHNRCITDGYVKIAHGRDAADCPVSRGMYTGSAQQKTMIHVTLHQL